MRNALLRIAVVSLLVGVLAAPTAFGLTYVELKPEQKIAGFVTECIYENDANAPIGARFRHERSGFVADLFTIQSLPQAFMWFNTLPPSDQGEPHTCEHLLLGKGTKGRYVASMEDMLLGSSSAFTMQLRTCYHFNCGSGTENFFRLFEAKLDALLHPNYSDEEIRREVCHVGLTSDQSTGAVGLEEKGTVYNEMVRSFENPWGELMLSLGRMIYGENHPLSYDAGGYPPAIRTMKPADLRKFQEGAYHINNMGVVVSIPDDIAPEQCLTRLAEILDRVEPEAKAGSHPSILDQQMPPTQPAVAGEIRIVDFPAQQESEPGLLVFGWPTRNFADNNERYLFELLIENLAGDQTSILSRRFIDSQSRIMDVGATSVGSWVGDDWGHPAYIYFGDISRGACTPATIDSIRALILGEISAVAAYADSAPELLELNHSLLDRITARERNLRSFLNSPPRFGERSSGSEWMNYVNRLHQSGGFKRSLVFAAETESARRQLAGAKNIWRDLIARWQLDVQRPYAVAAVANTQLIADSESARKQRLEGYLKEIKSRYQVTSDEQAIQLFQRDYDAQTALIDSAAATIKLPAFAANPPMTLDDPLRFSTESINGQVPLVASTFENITDATVGLAFGLEAVPEQDLVYLAALPALITEMGVVTDSGALAYDQMQQRLRQEIGGLSAYFNANYRTQRVELNLRVEGSNQPEALRALEWLDRVLFDSYLSPENLPRIRDAVDIALANYRSTMRHAEEAWVEDPADAYWRQSNPLLLSADCFLTKSFNLHRVRWMLKDVGDPASFAKFMEELAAAGAGRNREALNDLLATLTGEKKETWSSAIVAGLTGRFLIADPRNAELVKAAAEDLMRLIPDVPDATLTTDWQLLCWQIANDGGVEPEVALARIRQVIETIRRTDNVRAWLVSNSATRSVLLPKLNGIIGKFNPQPAQRQRYSQTPIVKTRLLQRAPEATTPIYVGLVNENTRSGVHVNTADCASFALFTPDGLIDFLAARLYGGGGAHSMFMKTWSAGLAYSNGLRSRETTGRIVYYAERCPDLAQTMQFVVSELKKAPYDPALGDYAVAQAFGANRAGSTYESRGEAIARDLVDGITPQTVRAFREGILALHRQPNFYQKVQSRMESVYGLLLPDYGPSSAESVAKANAVNFAIGPEKQLQSYERYLQSVEPGAKLYRIFPRDYWLVPELPGK